MRTVCFGSDDGGLSYGPYKQVVAVKSMNNYTNKKPNEPHGFKEQVKIKYEGQYPENSQIEQPPCWNYSVMHNQ